MAKQKGRPPGSGHQDETVLAKMALAIAKGERPSAWAATLDFLGEVSGNSDEARRRRLHGKFKKNEPRLLEAARRSLQEDQTPAALTIARGLVGKTKAQKIKLLARYYKAMEENLDIPAEVSRYLERRGTRLSPGNAVELARVAVALAMLEASPDDNEEK